MKDDQGLVIIPDKDGLRDFELKAVSRKARIFQRRCDSQSQGL